MTQPTKKTFPMLKYNEKTGLFDDALYSAKLLGFPHKGQIITNPYFSPDGQSPADPVKDYGFEEGQTRRGERGLVLVLKCGERLVIHHTYDAPDAEDNRNDLTISRLTKWDLEWASCSLGDVPVQRDLEKKPTVEESGLSL